MDTVTESLEAVRFNEPYIPEKARRYIATCLEAGHLAGNGPFGLKCVDWLRRVYGFQDVFLTPSGTAALEMGIMLMNLGPGDEVILPSYTFSSTATAIMLHGAKPVFCDVDPRTMNMCPVALEKKITRRTKLIVPIDYAGAVSDLVSICQIANRFQIPVLVDAAQSLHSKDKLGRWSGTGADLVAFSFHETKNVGCGEGGALVVNDTELIERAYVIQEKGTDRKKVLDGVKSKYSWVDHGSSYLLSDVLAALLLSQLEAMSEIVQLRRVVVEAYLQLFEEHDLNWMLPDLPPLHSWNFHSLFIRLNDSSERANVIASLKNNWGVNCYIGYMPLHESPMGAMLGYSPADCPNTSQFAGRIIRLPVYPNLAKSPSNLLRVCSGLKSTLADYKPNESFQ